MLLSVFSPLYELVCGVNSNYPEYRTQLFGSTGLLTIVLALIIGLLFYVVLGRWKLIWFNKAHWAATIALCALFGFLLAFISAKSLLGLVDGYLLRFALFNAIFAAVFFILFSFLLKNFSIFSKRTPF